MAQGATNYAEKYESELNQAYTLSSVIAGKTNTEYTFDGNRSVHVFSAVTQPLNDYQRFGVWRYGNPQELEDDVQDFTLKLDKSFSMTIDRGNSKDNLSLREGRVVRQQLAEQVTPFFDKNALTVWSNTPSTGDGILGAEAPTKDNVITPFVKARSMFVNQHIKMGADCYAYVPTSTTYASLLMNPDFISIEKLGQVHLENGEVGRCMNWRIIEVPDEYLPDGVFVLFTHKPEVFAPTKISELNIHNEKVPGISGILIEGRYYGDAFVRKTMVNETAAGTPAAGKGTFKVHGVITAKSEA